MVSKLASVSWPKGTFVETVKEWQKQWFYITEPRGANWAAAAEFHSDTPMRLTSWVEKSPNWSSSDDLIALQTRVQSMVDKDIKLVDIIQVMLVCRILPCQRQTRPLWEFNPKKHHTLKRLFETSHEDAWKLLFKGNETPPATTLDCGYSVNRSTSKVNLYCILYLLVSRMISKLLLSWLLQEWMEKAKRIQCPAPLPEELVIPCLARMLVPAPYTVLEKKATGKAKGVRSGPAAGALRT